MFLLQNINKNLSPALVVEGGEARTVHPYPSSLRGAEVLAGTWYGGISDGGGKVLRSGNCSYGRWYVHFVSSLIASYRSSLHCHLHWSFIIYAFWDDLWTSLQSPFYWYLISRRKKISFFVFNSKGSITTSIFLHEKHTKGPTRPERDLVARGPP
jgi:hypothetical protein